MNIPEYYKSPQGRIFGIYRGKSEVKDPKIGRVGKYFTIAILGSGSRNFPVSDERFSNPPQLGAPCMIESPLTVFANLKSMIILQSPQIRILKTFPTDPNNTDIFTGVGKIEKRPVNENKPNDFFIEFRGMGFVTTVKVDKEFYDSENFDPEKHYRLTGQLKSAGGYRQLENGKSQRVEVYEIKNPKIEKYEFVQEDPTAPKKINN